MEYIIQPKIKKHKTSIKSILIEKASITLLYFCIISALIFRARTLTGRSSGFGFEWFPMLPYTIKIPGLKFLTRPESTLVLYAAMMRPITGSNGLLERVSYLTRFNLILLLLLEMIQLLFLDYWDVISRKGPLPDSNYFKKINLIVYSFIFSLFLMLYLYCYLFAMVGRIAKFPGIFSAIPLSAQYWLKSKILKTKRFKNNS